jgi:transcriptional regulator of heat shock response
MTKKVGSELNHRSRKILYAVVSEYLQTGEAVGHFSVLEKNQRRGVD